MEKDEGTEADGRLSTACQERPGSEPPVVTQAEIHCRRDTAEIKPWRQETPRPRVAADDRIPVFQVQDGIQMTDEAAAHVSGRGKYI